MDYNKINENGKPGPEKGTKRGQEQGSKTKPEPVNAKVVDCDRLNIREKSNLDADILGRIKVGEIVIVDKIVGDWAHVCTSAGIEGFVMRKYIKVNK